MTTVGKSFVSSNLILQGRIRYPKNWMRITQMYMVDILYNHVIRYPTPISLTYAWSFGSLAGISLIIQIVSGIFLSMHYTPHIDLAFDSVEYIMRDVKNGWLLRYIHANGASMFFIVVYCHMGRGLYYGSYMFPRKTLWCSGVVIFLLMMATAFTGYVLPWGQMSFWGATVITNVRGRKVSKMSRFQENSLLLDKSIDELSSFQTAKKILWQVKQGGFNDIWNQRFLQIAKRSCCILFVTCQSVPTSAEKKSLRKA